MNRFIRTIAVASFAGVLLGVLAAGSQNPPVGSAAPQAGTTSPSQSLVGGRTGLNIVVLDPAHGGTDPGARGSAGIREADIVLELTAQVRRGLESQGFQVLQTRSNTENPSFDERSALANAQTGAIFVSLHVSSTGLPGTARVYTMPDMPLPPSVGGLIPWDQAQASYLSLSRITYGIRLMPGPRSVAAARTTSRTVIGGPGAISGILIPSLPIPLSAHR